MIGQVGPAVNAAVGPVAGGQIRLESLGPCHLHHWCRGAWGELWGGPRGTPTGWVAGETPEDTGKGRGLAGGGCGAGSTHWRCLQRKGPPAEVWGRLSAACSAKRRGTDQPMEWASYKASRGQLPPGGYHLWDKMTTLSFLHSVKMPREGKETTGGPRIAAFLESEVQHSQQSLGTLLHQLQQPGMVTIGGSPGKGQACRCATYCPW